MERDRTWRGKRVKCVLCHSQGGSKVSWHPVCPYLFSTPRMCSKWNPVRGVVSRFPVFSGLTAGTTFFFISCSCLATLLLPMVYWTGHPLSKDHSPVRSEFSPRRESKSPGPPKPRSRVRYEDDERKLRRQRQYTAGGVGSSRSRSSKSSRRSLVGSPYISADDTADECFSIAVKECH